MEEIGDEQYDEYLDEEGPVNVRGIEFYPSCILSKIDPTAYNCGKNDWTDSLRDEVQEELDGMDEGEETEIWGVTVEVPEEEGSTDEGEES